MTSAFVFERRDYTVGKGSQRSGPEMSATTAPAIEKGALDTQLLNAENPEQCCTELSRIFGVRRDEIGLLRLENELLRFLFPRELATAATIPLSSNTAVAAQTAVARKAVLFNTFRKVKHASTFEKIKLKREHGEERLPSTIHKLMSAPVIDKSDSVLGVLQICRKGFDPGSAGPDFTVGDLQKLELVTQALAQLGFMRRE
jgi:hypothetical protein